ncbi:MAG: hypothetical protein GX641_00520 [Mollicutes bacterium]|nr:hypothetical protein [Mollicutes bacterium]
MDLVEQIYGNGKLLVRAMDWPTLQRNGSNLEYNCTTWANEFDLLLNKKLSSASTTLIVPNVGVSTYKNIGFLMNADLVNCFHIGISDSGSSGNIENGDFFANASDFNNINELSNYIKENNSTAMNEINVVAMLDSVVGLFLNKCDKSQYLLSQVIVVQKMLNNMLGIDYPIYLYDSKNGRIEKIELTTELQEEIISSLKTKNIFYWPDDYSEPVFECLDNIKSKIL